MARPAEIVARQGTAALRIEYVKSRKVLRLTAWDHERELKPFEIALPALVDQLEIDAADLAAPVHYLLFAGRHVRPHGGAGDLVGTFESEPSARQAFHRLREGRSDREGWADLTALDRRGRLTHLAWFGRNPRTDVAVDRVPALRRRLFRSRPKVLAIAAGDAVG